MQDRTSTHPGRIRATVVSSTVDPTTGITTYTVDIQRADEPTVSGTALNRASLLSDNTALRCGCANTQAEKNAYTPNNALFAIGDTVSRESCYTSFTLAVSGWDSNKKYSLESLYPAATYNIAVEVSGDATDTQLSAWNAANIVGSKTTDTINCIYARGIKPTVAIPVIITITKYKQHLKG